MRLAGSDAADQHDVGVVLDEVAPKQFEDSFAVQAGLRIEVETVERLEDRKPSLLSPALNAPLPASLDLECREFGQVLGMGLPALACLLGLASPLRCHRRQLECLEIRHEVRRFIDRCLAHEARSVRMS